MPNLNITCDNCGSTFVLSYEEDEVSYSPTHCPFCGDYFNSNNEELDFNDEEIEEDSDDFLKEDDHSRH